MAVLSIASLAAAAAAPATNQRATASALRIISEAAAGPLELVSYAAASAFPARFWVEPDDSGGKLSPDAYRSYDFVLDSQQAERHTVSVFEIEGCVRSMRFSIHAPEGR